MGPHSAAAHQAGFMLALESTASWACSCETYKHLLMFKANTSGIGGFPNLGLPFGGPYKEYSILGSI